MIYRFGACELDAARYELRQAGQLVAIEPKVFAVLLYLIEHRDRIVTKEELLAQCWPGTHVSEAALTRCLTKVRKAIRPDRTLPPMVQTVHGKGYRFAASVETTPSATASPVVAVPLSPANHDVPFSQAPGVTGTPRPSVAAAEIAPVASPLAPEPHGQVTGLLCSQCHTANRAERQFCAACGHELWWLCPHCGFHNSPAERFCGGCGHDTAAIVPVPTATRTGSPRAYTPAHLARKILTSQPSFAGERKPVTVVMAAIRGLQALHHTHAPDEMDAVLNGCFTRLIAAIHRVEGFVTQVAGHSIIALFGAPLACEDHVLRALHAALGMQRTFTAFATDLRQAHGVSLTLHLSAHTGLVGVREISQDLQVTYTAPGTTVQVATELQHLSHDGAIVVSEAVQQQATGFFQFTALGPHTLPEVLELVPVYICTGVGPVTSRLEGALARRRTPLQGRQQELALLAACWTRACRGTGQTVCIIGEAGIGKSRLAYECHRIFGEARWLIAQALSYGQAMPYHAVIPLLRNMLGIVETDESTYQYEVIQTRLATLTPPLTAAAPLLAHLLGISLGAEPLPALSPEAQRRRLLHACLQLFLQQETATPLCLLVEDGHWLDPSSQELLDMLVASLARRPFLVLCTARPGFRHPWADYTYFHRITVEPLTAEETVTLVRDLLHPYDASAALHALIHDRTGGNPFFVEECVQALQGHTRLTLRGQVYEMVTEAHVTLPVSIQGIVQARLDRLPAEEKHLMQVAAVIGPEIALPLLQAVTEQPEEELNRHLKHLQGAEFLYEMPTAPVPTYTFKHILAQEAVYQSLLQPQRQHYHQHIAQLLATRFPQTVETRPDLLAQHYTAAGLVTQAMPYWQQAGRRAVERSAHVEAISHLSRNLELLMTLPDTPERRQHELALLIALGVPLVATKGYAAPEVAQVYGRARELSQEGRDPIQRLLVLRGLEMFYLVRGEAQPAQELGEQIVALAYQQDDPARRVTAHLALGQALFLQGALPAAREHLEQGLALYAPRQHHYPAWFGGNPGVACASFAALVWWLLGYPQQALTRSQEAVTLAQELAPSFAAALPPVLAAMLHHYRRDVPAVQQWAEAAVNLATEQGFALWAAVGTLFRGWALAVQGQETDGLAQMHQGLQVLRATGAGTFLAYTLTLSAEVHGRRGQPEEGLRLLAEGLTVVDTYRASYHAAELYRLQGELLLTQTSTPPPWQEAEESLQQALALARHQHAKSLELRTAISLARLWRQQDKHAAARQLLAAVYSWFTEGFDTADLQEAQALLEALA